ncbi:glycosyltransferase family 1 protein [Phormidesmis priestleyi ULC007]|uniref:Glycosyltransferase family 1 protein n=1 Tax=Phormidesmis priestleyi ULC007 TaxID=1920490 RepID=A0A2T1DJL1_9CYAN|nr:glycosyltransferase family 4 protein [Phormidesmis priestleyi]PSB20651.1 glycosyltransferase family 1 protein [Phormidesmis priestleyi ULC007]PZO54321.1 MAG: glycosyltransferase family 1 protein [Phormidesmis priestleyi]
MNTPRIFSVIEGYIGHRTYGQLMQNYFSHSDGCNIDLYWHDQDRELHSKLLRRLLSYQSSNHWVRKQNFDLFLFRVQLALAYLSRRVLLRNLGKADYSALHFHTQPLAYLCLDLMREMPTVISLDRTAAQASREYTKPNLRWTFSPNLRLDKKVFEAAKDVVTFSEAARRSVIDDYGIIPEKVTVIYPGVDLKKIPLAASTTKSKPYKILFVGGDFERKGGHDLVKVFLEKFADRAELHLVTQTPIQADHPNIYLYKNIKAYTPEWLQLYHQADVFAMPTYAEPFGWVFLEAMAAGLPIIATHITAIPEMVTHGENGFLIEPGDRTALAQSIEHLINSPELGQKMGQQGRQLVEQKFNAQTHFEKLENLLKGAIAPPYAVSNVSDPRCALKS